CGPRTSPAGGRTDVDGTRPEPRESKPEARATARAPFWPYPLALAALMVLGYVLGELIDIDRQTEPESLDYHVWTWVVTHRDRYPRLTALARRATRLGNPEFATPTLLAIAGALFALQRLGVGRLRRGE